MCIQENCPQVLTKFIKKSDELLEGFNEKPCKIDVLFDESYKVDDCDNEAIDEYKDEFKTYINIVRDVCEVFANESQAEMGE